MKRYLFKIFFIVLLYCLFCNIQNTFALSKAKILNLRSKEYSDYIRFVVDISQKPTYKTLVLHNPERVVIDIENTDYMVAKSDFEAGKVIDSIRTGKFGIGIRIVLDINVEAKIRKHFILSPSESKKNWRLVIDIDKKELKNLKKVEKKEDVIGQFISEKSIDKEDQENLDVLIGGLIEVKAKKIEKPSSVRRQVILSDSSSVKPMLKPNLAKIKEEQSKRNKYDTIEQVLTAETQVYQKNQRVNRYGGTSRNPVRRGRKYNIVIDAGHGGKDPGAIGRRRTKEKILTLQYVKVLKKELEKTGRYNVYLTRKGNYFISLNERVKKARKYKADLFISIHADSSPNKRTRGMSVYTLSQRASDTRTAKLAKKENKADIIGGLNLYGEYQDTINVLVDLSRREAMNSSSQFAEVMLRELKKKKIRALSNAHKYGNFAVLLAPDTASVLIELGFLSNRADERLMKTWAFKQKFASGVVNGVDRYFRVYF